MSAPGWASVVGVLVRVGLLLLLLMEEVAAVVVVQVVVVVVVPGLQELLGEAGELGGPHGGVEAGQERGEAGLSLVQRGGDAGVQALLQQGLDGEVFQGAALRALLHTSRRRRRLVISEASTGWCETHSEDEQRKGK